MSTHTTADVRSNKVGNLRLQSALEPSDATVFIKMIDAIGKVRYYKATRSYPDTAFAPAGEGFYIEVREMDLITVIR